MTILDILIIYLACGSPFAVNNLVRTEGKPAFSNILSSAALAIYWPLLIPSAFKRVVRRQKVSDARPSDLVDSRSDSIFARSLDHRRMLENEGLILFAEPEFARFRNIIDRYLGISCAICEAQEVKSPSKSELFGISGHTDEAAAIACLARRNRQRLETHQAIARSEFFDAVFRLETLGSTTALEIATKLARSISDRSGESELMALENNSVGKARAA